MLKYETPDLLTFGNFLNDATVVQDGTKSTALQEILHKYL